MKKLAIALVVVLSLAPLVLSGASAKPKKRRRQVR
jgi:hypothetical protein